MRIKFIILLYALLMVYPGHLTAKEIEFRPLNLYLADVDPGILGIGGIDITRAASLPAIYHLTALPDQQRQLSYKYVNENVYSPKSGSYAGAKIGSTTSEAFAVYPFEAPYLNKSAIAFLYEDYDFIAKSPRDTDVPFIVAQDYAAKVLALSATPFSFLKAGTGWESYRGRDAIFYEMALLPSDNVSLNYRQFEREMNLGTLLEQDSHAAIFNISPFAGSVRELSVNVGMKEAFAVNAAVETNRQKNNTLQLRVYPYEFIDLGCRLQRMSSDFTDDIITDGTAGGHINGTIKYYVSDFDINIHQASTRYIAGIRTSSLEVEGAGTASGSSILSFWEDLFAGDRYFNYRLFVRSTQYYAGIEDKMTDKFTLRGGLQYIVTRLDGHFDNWTPVPFIGIGRLDEEVTSPAFTKAALGALTVGFSYRFTNNMEIVYGLGQLVPLRTEKKTDEGATTASGVGEGGSVHGKRIWDKIKENPGGNVQSLKLTWYF